MKPTVYADANGILIRTARRGSMVGVLAVAITMSVALAVVTYLGTKFSLVGLLLLAPLGVMVGYTTYLARMAVVLFPDETVTADVVRCARRRGFAGGRINTSDIAAVYRRTEGDATGVELALTDGRHAQLRLTARDLDDDGDVEDVDELVAAVARVTGCRLVSPRTEPFKI